MFGRCYQDVARPNTKGIMDCGRNDWYIVPCSDSETIFYQKKHCISAIDPLYIVNDR